MSTAKEPPKLPEVKKNIRALLISAPRGLSVEDIEHDYQAVLGQPLPFQHYKCKSALEFLKTMPDVVCPTWSNGILILKGIADDSSKHIAKLVSRQRVNGSKSRRISSAPISTKPLVVPDRFRRNIKELLSVYPNGVLGSALCQAYSRHYGEELSHSKLGFKSTSQLLNALQDIARIVKNPRGGFRVCAVVRKNKPKSPPTVRKNSLLPPPSSKPPPPKAPASKPPSQNVPPSRMPLSRASSKAQAPKGGANVMPSKRRPLTDFNSLEGDVSAKKDEEKTNVEKVKALLDSKSGVSEAMKDELISVLAKRPNGVWAARLPFEYKTLLGKDLNILAVGFYSIIEMASAMPDIFRIERPFPNGDWLLFLAAKCRKDKNLAKVNVPENAIGKGIGYSQQSVPEEYYIELYVTHIRTPDCFWIQLRENEDELCELQTNMREFYSSKESAKFLVDDSLVKLGQVCVAKFPVDHEWYRGLITAIPSQLLVEVFYVDYGNSSQVSKSDIRLMKKDFFQLPSQAIKCKLANVTPKMSKWDPKASYRLNELTANKGLVGVLNTKKVSHDDVLNIFICDTNGKDDIHINDKLVEEGFAEFKRVNGRTTPPGLPLPEPIQHEINQQITLNTVNPVTPAFPDYSIPLFTGYPFDFSMPLINMPAIEPVVPQVKEEIAPTNIEVFEEKPTDEELEFMRQVCEELSDAISVVVKRLNLPGEKVVHVIKFEEKAYVVRSEISALLWDSDNLRSMLRNAKKVIEKEVISKEDHEQLFDELRRLKVGDFGGEEVKEYASLYPLTTVPEILESFNHPSPELVQMIKNEVTAYEQNPGAYWSDENNVSEEGTDDSYQSEADEEHDLEELRLAEQALQFARKRILRAMTSGDTATSENIVDEASDVEKRLEHIRKLIMSAEAKEAAKGIDGSKQNPVSQEEKIEGDSNGASEATQPEPRPAKPVGVTRPEVRQPENSTTENPHVPIPASQYPIISTSTSQYPGITMSTPQGSNVPTSAPQYHEIPSSVSGYPDIVTSIPHIQNMNPQIPNTLASIPQYSNIPTFASNYQSVPTSASQNGNLSNTTPQSSTEIVGAVVDKNDENEVYPGTSVDNHQQAYYKSVVESAKQTIEKISLNNKSVESIEPASYTRKRTRSSSQAPHHAMLPPSNQALSHFPLFMPGSHMSSVPQLNFPFPGPPNMQFQGFLGPLHPISPPPFHSDLMHLNGPLSAPNLVNPSQLLFQYGSPFPSNHPRRAQR